MATLPVLDAGGNEVDIEKPNANGQQSMANSRPVVLPSDQIVPILLGAGPVSTGTITGTSQTVAIDVSKYSSVRMAAIGTFGTVGCSFEWSPDSTNGSDGNWFAQTMARTNSSTVESTTGNLTNTPAYGWMANTAGAKWMRVRSTAYTSGSQAWTLIPCAVPINTLTTVQGIVSLTGTMLALIAGTAAIGDVGQQYRANATGAGTPVNLSCPATPAAQVIKAGAGRLIGGFLNNTNASQRYLKIFNVAAASVTPGTTAATLDIPIPASGIPDSFKFEGGIAFSSNMSCMITGGRGLTDNTAVTGNEVTGFLIFA